jgi:hypothetical protein
MRAEVRAVGEAAALDGCCDPITSNLYDAGETGELPEEYGEYRQLYSYVAAGSDASPRRRARFGSAAKYKSDFEKAVSPSPTCGGRDREQFQKVR